jgi:FeS assembly SUF system protein
MASCSSSASRSLSRGELAGSAARVRVSAETNDSEQAFFGVSATCRASFGLYNTRAEVDGLAQALIKAGFLCMTDDANQIAATTAATPAEAPPASSTGAPSALPEGELARLTDDIIAALKTVYDPEIPSDIYELGLIYKIDIADDRAVAIEMTLTTPNCPSAQELPTMVENAVASVPGVGEVKVNIVWDPPWDPSRMSDDARAVLNMW